MTMKILSKWYRSSIAIGLLASQFVCAQVEEYIASPQAVLVDPFSSYLFVDMNGGSPPFSQSGQSWWLRSLPNTTVAATLELDRINHQAILKSVRVNLNETMRLDRMMNGRRIQGSVTFDSALEFVDHRRIPLIIKKTVINQDPSFYILKHDDFRRYLGAVKTTTVAGSYSISGPTETVEGTFLINPHWQRGVDYGGKANIDLAAPTGLILSNAGIPIPDSSYANEKVRTLRFFADTEFDPRFHLFTVNVDGVELSFDLTHLGFATPHSFVFAGKSGDIDRNGLVNMLDLVLINDHLSRDNLLTLDVISRANLDGDNSITDADRVLLIDRIFDRNH